MSEVQSRREAYGEVLVELGKEYKDIVVLDADLSGINCTDKFAEKYPERFFNIGIAEQNMIGVAAGLSTVGKIPFASTFACFASMRACEIIRTSVAYPKLNVKIVVSYGGLSGGKNGPTHLALEDIAIMRSIPNMIVIEPADVIETELVIRAIVEYKGPVYVRLGREKEPQIFKESHKFKIGKGVVIKDGTDITIIAIGMMVARTLNSAEILEKQGISVRVINMSTIKPIDEDIIIESANKTGAIVTVEEHNIIGGLGDAVGSVLVENIPVPLRRIGIKDTFTESGENEDLRKKYGLTAEHIVEVVKEILKRKSWKK